MPAARPLTKSGLVQTNFLLDAIVAEQLRCAAHELRLPQADLIRHGVAVVLADLAGHPIPPRTF